MRRLGLVHVAVVFLSLAAALACPHRLCLVAFAAATGVAALRGGGPREAHVFALIVIVLSIVLPR